MNNDEQKVETPATRAPVRLFQILVLVVLWNTGFKGARVASTLFALELGAKPLETGLLLTTYAVFPLLLGVYAGRVADRYGVRAPLMAGMTACALGVLLPFFQPSFPALFVSAALSGAGFIFVQIAMQSLVGGLGTGMDRTRNINAYALLVSVADFIGPVVGGLSIDHFGHARAFLHLGLISAAGAVGTLYFFTRFPAGAPAADRGKRRMMDLFRNAELRRILIVGSILITSLDLFQLYLPLYGHSVGLSASAIGFILGAFAASSFASRALIPMLSRRYGEDKTLLYSMFLAAATFLLIPFFRDAAMLGLICFLLGLGMGLGQPLLVILTYNHAPPGRAGEALGLRAACNNSIHVVMPTLFGALGTWLGLAPVFWVSGLFLAAGARVTRTR
jgi:MFS family permease